MPLGAVGKYHPKLVNAAIRAASYGYRAYNNRGLIGAAASTLGMASKYRRGRKRVRGGLKKRKRKTGSGSGTVLGQYAQRTGRVYRGGRRASRFQRRVKSILFKQIPTQSLVSTNLLGTFDNGKAINLSANSHQAWTYVGMYGAYSLPSNDLYPQSAPDQDLWNMYKQWYASNTPAGSGPNDAAIRNNFQLFVMNGGVTIDFKAALGEDSFGPMEVTFYVITPRVSQRLQDKSHGNQTVGLVGKMMQYFDEDYNYNTTTGTPAFNQVNPITTYDATPFDSRTMTKCWKVLSSKTIIVNDDQTASFSWGRKRPFKVSGAVMDEYDYLKGVYTGILVRIKPLGISNSPSSDHILGHMKFKKHYTYKFINPSISSSVGVIKQNVDTIG